MFIVSIVGARPQFIKAAAVSRAIAEHNQKSADRPIVEKIVHTGQHYDENMSKVFFEELQIPEPFENLKVGSGSHGRQTGLMLERIEEVLRRNKPDLVMVYGDTNSTLAGALAAAKLHIPVGHVEAGLRSFNRKMPEEINRVVTDHLSQLLFCPTDKSVANLAKEGITSGVHQVGDVMYDSVLFYSNLAEKLSPIMSQLALQKKSFYLATVHRAENTDTPQRLENIITALGRLEAPVVVPLHPRTSKNLEEHKVVIGENVRIIPPVSYLDMLILEKNARIILTDSGGVQKESFWFKVPCVTLRDETEWVELIEAQYNQVVGADKQNIIAAVDKAELMIKTGKLETTPELYGDGFSAESITKIVADLKRSF